MNLHLILSLFSFMEKKAYEIIILFVCVCVSSSQLLNQLTDFLKFSMNFMPL